MRALAFITLVLISGSLHAADQPATQELSGVEQLMTKLNLRSLYEATLQRMLDTAVWREIEITLPTAAESARNIIIARQPPFVPPPDNRSKLSTDELFRQLIGEMDTRHRASLQATQERMSGRGGDVFAQGRGPDTVHKRFFGADWDPCITLGQAPAVRLYDRARFERAKKDYDEKVQLTMTVPALMSALPLSVRDEAFEGLKEARNYLFETAAWDTVIADYELSFRKTMSDEAALMVLGLYDKESGKKLLKPHLDKVPTPLAVAHAQGCKHGPDAIKVFRTYLLRTPEGMVRAAKR